MTLSRGFPIIVACVTLLATPGVQAQVVPPPERKRFEPTAVIALAFSPDGKTVAAVTADGAARFWDAASGKERLKWEAHKGGAYAAAFSPDGKVFATAGHDKLIRLWDEEGKERARLAGHEKEIACVAFSPDGKTLVSGGLDGTIRFWGLGTGKEQRKVQAHGEGVLSLRYSQDGKVLASAGMMRSVVANIDLVHADRPILWDGPTGRELRKLEAEAGVADLTADGRALATLGYKTVVEQRADGGITLKQTMHFGILDAFTGRPLFKLSPAVCSCFAFSPDGRALATADNFDTVQLWELATGKEAAKRKKEPGGVLLFSPDGQRLATGTKEGRVVILDVHRPEPLPKDLDKLWDVLGGDDAAAAHLAIGSLTADPARAVAFLKDRLKPAVAKVDPQQVRKLIADLDHEDFATRESATRELTKLADDAEPMLREVLASGKPSLETGKRLEAVLAVVKPRLPVAGEALRSVRCIQVLEGIGTREAREVLEQLAGGAPGARQTQEAKLALERLARRTAASR